MRPSLLIAVVIAGVLWSMSPVEAAGLSGTFVDDDDSVHESAIEAVAIAKITVGCNPPTSDRYCPESVVTRGQMAAFLRRGFEATVPTGPATEFVDDDTSIFEADIEWLGASGITVGCNPPAGDRFCPADWVTRGQMAAFLVRALGLTDRGTVDFVDVEGSVYEADIERLATAGVTIGCNPPANDRFCPTSPVTREQMASFLARALELPQSPPVADLASGWACSKDRQVCGGTVTSPGSRTLRIREGWDQALPYRDGEASAFRASTTRFELRIDGVTRALGGPTESEGAEVVTRRWTTDLVTPASGSLVIEGRWYWQDTLIRRTRVVVSIG